MSVVVRERAPECAASRARRASGREARDTQFLFCVAYRDAWATAKVANEFACKALLYKTLSPFSGTFSDQRFAGMPRDLLTCSVAQANNFVPIGGLAFGNFRPQRRRERDRNGGWAREERSVAQKTTRASQRNGNDGNSRNDGRVECAELKRPDAFFWNEGTFRKNKNRISIANG